MARKGQLGGFGGRREEDDLLSVLRLTSPGLVVGGRLQAPQFGMEVEKWRFAGPLSDPSLGVLASFLQ